MRLTPEQVAEKKKYLSEFKEMLWFGEHVLTSVEQDVFDTIEAQRQEIEKLKATIADWKYNAKCDADHIAALTADKDELVEKLQKLNKSDASKEQCIIDQQGQIHRLRDELKRYKQAEQEGRLYNLPLKPGDTIYRPEGMKFVRPIEWVVVMVEIHEDNIVFVDDSDNIFEIDDIGKSVFLTHKDAEKAIGGGKK